MGICKSAFLFVVLLVLTACNFTEEVRLEQDGSGTFSIAFDGSEMMVMAMDEVVGEEEKAMDTIVSFKDLLEEKKDSIAQLPKEEQERIKRLENFKMRMHMDPVGKEMLFDLFSSFTDISEMNDAFNTFQDASALGPNTKTQQSQMNAEQATRVKYAFKKNTFTRKAEIVDQTLLQQQIDSLQGAKMFLSGSTYTLKYHFPKKVIATSVEGATFSADGRTLYYEVGFLEMMKEPSLLDIEVELEE